MEAQLTELCTHSRSSSTSGAAQSMGTMSRCLASLVASSSERMPAVHSLGLPSASSRMQSVLKPTACRHGRTSRLLLASGSESAARQCARSAVTLLEGQPYAECLLAAKALLVHACSCRA